MGRKRETAVEASLSRDPIVAAQSLDLFQACFWDVL
jgi:hypothetical protein